MPAPHHSVFYRPDAFPAGQSTAWKHWRHISVLGWQNIKVACSKWWTCECWTGKEVVLWRWTVPSSATTCRERGSEAASQHCSSDQTCRLQTAGQPWRSDTDHTEVPLYATNLGWSGSWVVSVLDSGAEGPGFKSQSRCCRVTVLGKLLTPIVTLLTKQQNW